MKKNALLLFVLYFFVQRVFAAELWNGFTDDMTQEEVIVRARNVLSVYSDELDIEEQKYFSDISRRKIEMFHGDQEYRNEKFILPDVILYFSCYDSAMDDDSSSRNIAFYFFNNKLYAIYIRWNKLISNEVVQKSKENYGKNYKEITDYSPEDKLFFVKVPESRTKWLYWDYEEKEIYLRIPDTGSTIWDYKKAELYAISKNHYAEYKEEINHRLNIQKEQATEEKQRKVDSIKF